MQTTNHVSGGSPVQYRDRDLHMCTSPEGSPAVTMRKATSMALNLGLKLPHGFDLYNLELGGEWGHATRLHSIRGTS